MNSTLMSRYLSNAFNGGLFADVGLGADVSINKGQGSWSAGVGIGVNKNHMPTIIPTAL